jgi:hypothetical protein
MKTANDFAAPLAAILGESAKGLSAFTIHAAKERMREGVRPIEAAVASLEGVCVGGFYVKHLSLSFYGRPNG